MHYIRNIGGEVKPEMYTLHKIAKISHSKRLQGGNGIANEKVYDRYCIESPINFTLFTTYILGIDLFKMGQNLKVDLFESVKRRNKTIS